MHNKNPSSKVKPTGKCIIEVSAKEIESDADSSGSQSESENSGEL